MADPSVLNVATGYYATAATSRTFTLPIGEANEDRWVVPEITIFSGGVTRDLLTLTVNGVDCFPGKGLALYTGDSGTKLSTIYGRPIHVPAGTTCDIAISVDKSWVRVFCTAWAVTGITANSVRTLVRTGTVDTNPGGLAIDTTAKALVLVTLAANANPTYTFTGVDATPVYDSGTLAASQARLAHRAYVNHPAESGHVITAPLGTAQVNMLSAASYTFDDNSQTPSSVTTENFAQNEIIQRNGFGIKKADIKIKGTYGGTPENKPTRLQARGVRGTVEVYPWTDMTSVTIDGGFFSGTMPEFPTGYVGFAIQTRTFNASSTTVPLATSALTSTTFGVGDVIPVGGSSTASMFCATGAVNEPAPANCYRMDRLTVDANGNGVYGTNLGGGIRAIGNRLRALEPDIPIAFLDFAVTGSKLEVWVNAGNGDRLAMTNYIEKHQGKVACICIPFLATDIISDIPSQVGRFTTLIGQIRTACNQPNLPAFLGIGGQTDDANGPVAGDFALVQATIQMELNDPNVTVCSYRDRQYGTDGTHMLPVGVEQSGTRLGTQMAAVMRASGRAYKIPKALSYTYDATNGVFVVSFDLRGGNSLVGLTGQTGITGFRVSEDGFNTLLTIQSAVITAPDKVRIAIAERPINPQIDYFQGKHPDNTNSLCNNTSIVA